MIGIGLFLQAATLPPLRLTQEGCTSAGTDVVVCGKRSDRYRLPLPAERDVPDDRRTVGEPPSPMAAITPNARCGIFAGERRCSKREAAGYGYGNGRDPVTLLGRVADAIVDPDR